MIGDPGRRVEEVVTLLGVERALPPRFFIGGGGGLALRGIREAGDLDIGLTTAGWFGLASSSKWDVVLPSQTDERRRCDPPIARTTVERHTGELVTVDAWFSWRWRGFHETEWNDFNLVFRDGIEHVRGLPCLKLIHLLRMKVDAVQNGYGDGGMVRSKDVVDIGLIGAYLRGRP